MWGELATDEETLVWKILERCSRKAEDESWGPPDGVARLLVGQGLLKVRKGGFVTITAKGREALKRRGLQQSHRNATKRNGSGATDRSATESNVLPFRRRDAQG